jgi:hypothetical protein
VQDLTDPAGIAALVAGGVALVALLLAGSLVVRMRRLRADQRAILGGVARDLVGHSADLQRAFEQLHARVQDVAERLDERMELAEHRLDGAIAHRALVRYDAYGELSGHQSTSLALLDATHSGVVVSCITHRDTARFYCAQVRDGQGERELSPEEAEAIRLALAGAEGPVTLD